MRGGARAGIYTVEGEAMSDRPDNADEHLERLLRRWGAEEAAGGIDAPPLRRRYIRRGGAVPLMMRWAPLAAAAVVLLAAGALFVASRGRVARRQAASAPPQARDGAASPAPPPVAATQDAGLARLRDDLAAMRSELFAAQGRLGEETRRHEGAVKQLRDELAAAKAGAAAAAGEVERLKAHLARSDAAVRDAVRRGDSAEKDKQALAAAAAKVEPLASELAALKVRLRAAAEELARERKRMSATGAAYAQAQQELTAAKLHGAEAAAAMRRAYMRAAAPGLSGLAARQAAARRARMAERCVELRPLLAGPEAAELADRLEVVFARLAMLDASDAAAGESFHRLLERSGVMGQLEAVLAAAHQPPAVRDWLLEARCILAGA